MPVQECGVVVKATALHAQGPGFEPGSGRPVSFSLKK